MGISIKRDGDCDGGGDGGMRDFIVQKGRNEQTNRATALISRSQSSSL